MAKVFKFIFLISITIVFSCNRKVNNEPGAQSNIIEYRIFNDLSKEKTGVDFKNSLTVRDSFNIIDYLYYYNGGGVSIGDINNDSLPDIFLTSNMEQNELYLNLGGMKFKKITSEAGIGKMGNWSTGTVMADVNGDGYLDLYVCNVSGFLAFHGRNELYINNGDLTFTESAEEYGLDFSGYSTHAGFFDADNDGDLDMYLLNHSVHTARSYGKTTQRTVQDNLAGDRLFIQENGKFYDRTLESGIYSSALGYGLSVSFSDVNNDGYPDIYVANDFHENDYLYINKKDGTFKEELELRFGHTSRFSMGSDFGDLNGDGFSDLFVCDMMPEDESILKRSGGDDSYEIYKLKRSFGYYEQNPRNSLQINQGGTFKDIAVASNVDATDWSWGPLIADFDGDGSNDIFITNGIMKRPNDLDYINFISNSRVSKLMNEFNDSIFNEAMNKMPDGKFPNTLFLNKAGGFIRNYTFSGSTDSTYSTGGAYSDLDNDGDLDLVINNINDEVTILENTSNPCDNSKAILKLSLLNPEVKNRNGIGAKVLVGNKSGYLLREHYVNKGWQSSVSNELIFNLDSGALSTKVFVQWPGEQKFRIHEVSLSSGCNKIIITYDNSAELVEDPRNRNFRYSFTSLSNAFIDGDVYHQDQFYNEYAAESLKPFMTSTEGAEIVKYDMNGDGLEDFFLTGGRQQPTRLFIQDKSGAFIHMPILAIEQDSAFEDVAMVIEDLNNDGIPDIVLGSSGLVEADLNKGNMIRVYLSEDGEYSYKRKNAFKQNENHLNVGALILEDFDLDGNIDLFIGERSVIQKYGRDGAAVVFTWDKEKESFDFITRLSFGGMITDALFEDIIKDSDGSELLVVGEWMSPKIVSFRRGIKNFEVITPDNLENLKGLWRSVNLFKKSDNSTTVLLGNMSPNLKLRVSAKNPVKMYVGDFNANGSIDQILAHYYENQYFTVYGKNVLTSELPLLKKKYLFYSEFSEQPVSKVLEGLRTEGIEEKELTTLSNVMISFDDKGAQVNDLPLAGQYGPINSSVVIDEEESGVIAIGNFHGLRPEFGRLDANSGICITDIGTQLKIESLNLGFTDFRDIEVFNTIKGKVAIVSSYNDKLKTFFINKSEGKL
ncbi:VCBS repeat-containing protein [Marinigracilibium pacificum]|uniref:VCBS repeat-containing protein n=1 Tax=Marinigracilibium pacificum TaxID=2729599 RepID=A0A848J0S7_9BACT|nr:VCBS repeat-containing protein [Marinigracilibium pacificum]NMM48084.1 VCBS repeat-containing protein [Marinigracilibium pacificum]